MTEDDEDALKTLRVEVLALRSLFAHVLMRLASTDAMLSDVVRKAFDDAASEFESITIIVGKPGRPVETGEMLRVVEELRTTVMGHMDKPKRDV